MNKASDFWSQLNRCFEMWEASPLDKRDDVYQRLVDEYPNLEQELGNMVRHYSEAQGFMEQEETAPMIIGPYRVIHKLGSGGMGVVYLAERADGSFDQQVALKLMRATTALPSLSEKFLQERRVLAMMNHPCIVRLLDGGTTDDGVIYFTMEYVQGRHLIDYAKEEQLSLQERVALVIDVCDAVQAAHQNLFVHRDLKPSNIMVTDDRQVKLLDFGIAKWLDPDGDETGTYAMTPRYCSPEQILGKPITTASDIFAIGLILVELITKTHAFTELTSPFELQNAIVSKEAMLPSKRLQMSPLDKISYKQVRGDLDAICAKALRIETHERYQSASQLANDLTCWIQNKPVSARHINALGLLAKWVKRNQTASALLALLFVSWMAGSIQIWRQNQRVRQESAQVLVQRDRALEVSQFLEQLFEQANPEISLGNMPDAKELLDRGKDRLAQSFDEHPQQKAILAHSLCKVYFKLGLAEDALDVGSMALPLITDNHAMAQHQLLLGQIHLELGQYELADPLIENAAILFEDEGDQDGLALCLNALGDNQSKQGLPEKAATFYDRAWAIKTKTDLAPEVRISLLASRANHFSETLAYEKALSSFQELLALKLQLYAPGHPDIGVAHVQIANALRWNLQYEQAEQHFILGLEILEKTYPDGHSHLATSHNDFAGLLRTIGKIDEAKTHYQESLAMLLALYGEQHPHTFMSRANYGVFLAFVTQDYETAASHLEWAREQADLALPEDHQFHAEVRGNLAITHERLGNRELAAHYYKACTAHLRRVSQETPHPRLSNSLIELANFYGRSGKFDEAVISAREAVQLLEQISESNPKLVYAYQSFGQALLLSKQYQEAGLYIEKSDALLNQFSNMPWEQANQWRLQAEYFAIQGSWQDVRDLLSDKLITIQEQLGHTHPNAQKASQLLEQAKLETR